MAEQSNNFTAGGRVWTIRFSIATAGDLSKLGVEAVNPADLENLIRLNNDRLKLADVLWACVERKASEIGVTKDQFIDPLDGEESEAGLNALIEAFIRFNGSEVRPAMRQAMAEYAKAVKAASDEYIASLDRIDTAAMAKTQMAAAFAAAFPAPAVSA